jgi:hypothetical protein
MFTAKRWLTLAVVALIATPVRAADLSKYLPDDTEIVIGVNVSRLMESELVQKHVPTLVKRFGPDLVKLAAESTGQKVDDDVFKEINKFVGDADLIRKWLKKGELRRFIVGTNADFDDGSFFMIWEGDLSKDQAKELVAFLMKNKPLGIAVRTVKEGKYEFYGVKVPGDDDEMFFALADEKTVVCCQNKAALARVLGRAASDEKPAVRKELIDVASKIDQKAAFWMAAAPRETDEYVNAHASVTVTDGISFVASVTAKDADAARTAAGDLKDTLKDVAESLDDAVKQLPPLGMLRDALKKVEPKAEKNVVTIEAEVTGAMIDKLIKDLAGAR